MVQLKEKFRFKHEKIKLEKKNNGERKTKKAESSLSLRLWCHLSIAGVYEKERHEKVTREGKREFFNGICETEAVEH